MYPVSCLHGEYEKEEELGTQVSQSLGERAGAQAGAAGERGEGRGCRGLGLGGVPLLRVCLASLACPVLPEGRNRRNTEKRTRLTRGLGP